MKCTIMLILSFFLAFSAQAQFAGGDGSGGDPYQIETLEQLQEAADYRDQYFIQTADIDAADTETWNDGAGFIPLGEQDDPFTGSFDGNGFKIENLHVDRTGQDDDRDASLFGFIGGGVIENLTLENVTITGGNRTGGVVGRLDGGVIRDTYVSGVVNGEARTGGIVGIMTGGNVENSVSGAEVHGARNVGGVAGGNNGQQIIASRANGDVHGERDVGGLVGDNGGLVSQSHATGNVFVLSGDGHDAGGLAGVNDDTIEDSFATGDVEAVGRRIGGLVGQNDDGGTITNSYASGSATGEESAGGLVGANREQGEIHTSYSTGAASSSTDTEFGGLIGLNEATGAVTDSYWDTETSELADGVGEGDDQGVTGLSTGQMSGFEAEDNMAGFDFVGTWQITEDYPALHWEDVEALEPAVFAGGDGSEADPYQIETLDQLQEAADYRDQHFVQTADIDAADTETWNDGAGFIPLGEQDDPFTGSFDGNGFKIENLYVDRTGQDDDRDASLFGFIGDGVIEDLTLENVNIEGGNRTGAIVGRLDGGVIRDSYASGVVNGEARTGGIVGVMTGGDVENSVSGCEIHGDRNVGGVAGTNNDGLQIIASHAYGDVHGERDVGGLVGDNGGLVSQSHATGDVFVLSGDGHDAGGLAGVNEGEIEDSYATGDVEAIGRRTGGLVGQNDDGGSIANSYAFGSVSGDEMVGGLVGANREDGSVATSYSTGNVSSSSETEFGGFIGLNEATGAVTDSYWDTGTSELADGVGEGDDQGVTGLSTGQMSGFEAEDNMAGFDFVGTWQITEDYPALHWEDVEALEPAVFAGGDGSEEDPYQIETLDQLQAVADHTDQYFIQTADIDASDTENWNEGEGFMPIGKSEEFFEGTFDGDGFKIENLRIHRSEADYAVGLFSTVTGVVENVTLEEIIVEGFDHTGGLAGVLTGGKIINSSTSGEVSGSQPTGGLVGQNEPGEIIGSHSTSDVAGSRDVGGLVGECQDGGIVIDSYATGDVSTTHGDGHDVGGLVGANKGGEIYGSYATGDVSGIPENKRAGGLVGQHMSDGAIIENSYATGTVTGGELFAGGLVGRSRHEVTIVNSYSTGQASLISDVADEETVAGFAGVNADGSEIIDSYWDTESSDHTVGANEVEEGLTGLSTAEMSGQAAYENMTALDFQDIWMLTEDYPALRWEDVDSIPISSEPVAELPDRFSLEQNYPNPFNPTTNIEFSLPEKSNVTLEVFTIQGQHIATLVNKSMEAGVHTVTFDATSLASGMYLYRIQAGDFTRVHKMMFVK